VGVLRSSLSIFSSSGCILIAVRDEERWAKLKGAMMPAGGQIQVELLLFIL